MESLRIIFMGTPEFAVPALSALHNSDHEVIAVYTQPPRPKGRGHDIAPSPVHVFAQEHAIPVFHPASLKSMTEKEKFLEFRPDIAIVAAYGLILPKEILDAPVYGCINIHASLLPRWRGASPIQQAILQGDEETGITLMQMDEGLDTGPMIVSRAVRIHPHTTASALHDELAALGATMICDEIKALASGKTRNLTLQDEAHVTYAPLLKKQDGHINWSQTASAIDRRVRALNPWPGVWAAYEGKRVKILEAEPASGGGAIPGEILSREGFVSCGGGTALKILKLQPEGKKPMDFAAALNGNYAKLGGIFA